MPSIITRTMSALVVSTSVGVGWLEAQVDHFPYYESFDSITVPDLPPGWTTSIEKSPLGDFSTSLASPRSAPNAVISSDATISQYLTSPAFDLTSRAGDRLLFYERRSSSHNAGVLVEASLDGVDDFFPISDTLLNPGTLTYVLRSIPIPEILGNRADVKLRWRVIGNGTGKTATYRIDDVSLTVRATVDLAVTAVGLSSSVQNVGDLVTVIVTVNNLAESSASNFTVEFFLAAGEARDPSDGERFDSLSVLDPISPGDSVVVTSRPVVVSPTLPKIFVLVEVEGDEDVSNNFVWVALNVGFPRSAVIINEILYAPSSPEPEWIELFNTTADSISLKNWKLTDKSGSVSIVTSEEYFLRGFGYLVLADDASLLAVHPDLGPSLLIMNVPSLNNTGDAVVLFDHRDLTMDSLVYSPSWGGSGGRSLERVDPEGVSADPLNWGTSKDVVGSTPGKKNSLTPKDFDLGLSGMRTDPAYPLLGAEFKIVLAVINLGKLEAEGFAVNLFWDANEDGAGQDGEWVAVTGVPSKISPGDSAVISISSRLAEPGDRSLVANVSFPADEDTSNNRLSTSVGVSLHRGTVVINEIMYAPRLDQPEWVELYNTSDHAVDLEGWIIANHASASRYTIDASHPTLGPRQFLVITKDSSAFFLSFPIVHQAVVELAALPTFFLGNSGDAVILRDGREATMDSVAYLPSWGGQGGKSLERIDALRESREFTNWGTSLDSLGSTPGRKNSLVPYEVDLAIQKVVQEPLLPLAGSPLTLVVTVRNVGFRVVYEFEVRLALDENGDGLTQDGEILHSTASSQRLERGDSLEVFLSVGAVHPGRRCVIIDVKTNGDQNLRNDTAVHVVHYRYAERSVIINEIMFDPHPGGVEYVELYNRSAFDVSLEGWTVQDASGLLGTSHAVQIAFDAPLLASGSYAVLSSDSSLLEIYPDLKKNPGSVVIIFRGSGFSLNNQGDAVIVKDIAGVTIDSVSFSPQWHNPEIDDGSGRSLERIQPGAGSNDSRNWSTCADRRGGTPGAPNSLFSPFISSEVKISFSPNPFSPDGDGFEDFTILQYNLSVPTATIRVRVFDSTGRMVRVLSHGEPSGSRGEIIWDGLDDDRTRLRMGIYVVLLEAFDSLNAKHETAKSVVVLARRL